MKITKLRSVDLATALICLGATLAAATVMAQGSEQRPLTLEDRGQFKSITESVISADGNSIAYVFDNLLYLWTVTSGESTPLTPDFSSVWNIRWANDGEHLYFVSDLSGTNQVWQTGIARGNAAKQLTDFSFGVSSTAFSSNEDRILLSFTDNELIAKKNDEVRKPIVVTRRQFKRDEGQGYIVAGDDAHLYAYENDRAKLSPITLGDHAETDPAWSPDGEQVVFISNRDEDRDANYSNDVWVVTASGPGDPVRLTDNDRTKHSPAWSPDGKHIAYISARDGVYGMQHIAIVTAQGGEPVLLTASLDRWVHSFRFSADGRWIHFNFDDNGSTHLARVSPDGEILKIDIANDVVVHAFDVSANDTLLLQMQEENSSSNLYRYTEGKLTQLTDVNRKLHDQLLTGRKQSVSFPSEDGTRIQAFVTTPADFDRRVRYPAILLLHGGPVAQFAWGYDFRAQYLTSRGYVVIEPNPRGSTGRDQAFIHAIYRTWGITDYPDVMAAVDFAVDEGFADPDNLFVTGYSYGGYLTNVVITESQRFAAAASGAGHSYIAANVGHDMYQQWYAWEIGVPWENRAAYDRLSPLLRAASVTTPTLFLGGSHDWNVPILNAELFYQALRMKDVDSQLVVYPDAHHGGWSDEFENDYWQRVTDWFNQYQARPDK